MFKISVKKLGVPWCLPSFAQTIEVLQWLGLPNHEDEFGNFWVYPKQEWSRAIGTGLLFHGSVVLPTDKKKIQDFLGKKKKKSAILWPLARNSAQISLKTRHQKYIPHVILHLQKLDGKNSYMLNLRNIMSHSLSQVFFFKVLR